MSGLAVFLPPYMRHHEHRIAVSRHVRSIVRRVTEGNMCDWWGWDVVVHLSTFIWHGIDLICVACTAVVCVWETGLAMPRATGANSPAGFGSPPALEGTFAGTGGG